MTIFSVQRFLEDHFEQRGLVDLDQYAIRAANVFERLGAQVGVESIAREFNHIRTIFFRRNSGLKRGDFEAQLARTLRRRFKKKANDPGLRRFAKGLGPTRARLGSRRRSINALLVEFRGAVQSRAVDVFWVSRKQHRLRPRPEQVAQTLLAVFAKGVLGAEGLVLREIESGIGFVDVGVSFGGPLHLIELKILAGQFTGPSQLAAYMVTEGRDTGWLVVVDTRRQERKVSIPSMIQTPAGQVRTIVIEVNPVPPHSASRVAAKP